MICPHCRQGFHTLWSRTNAVESPLRFWQLYITSCPECKESTVRLHSKECNNPLSDWQAEMVYPKGTSRPPIPSEVDQAFTEDYLEACLVLADSPKASAALSRRSLQHLLRDKLGVKRGKLHEEIKEAIPKLPSHIGDLLEMVRALGNLAAHPEKDLASGQIIDIEPGEAESQLEAIEALFDHCFVQPEKTAARKAAVNSKLKAAGKQEIS